jgi:hypothetical protein
MKLSEALKITQTHAPAGSEKLRAFLACGFMPLHLATFLLAQLQLRLPDRQIELSVGNFGDLAGTLEKLQESSCDSVAVVTEWSDFDPRLGLRSLGGWGSKVMADTQKTFEFSANRFLNLLEKVAQSKPVVLCGPTLPLPPILPLQAAQSGIHDLFLRKTLQEFLLKAAHIPGLRLVNQQLLDELSPPAERLDVKSDLSAGFPYRLPHASHVAELLANLIQPHIAKKGLHEPKTEALSECQWR